MKAPEPSTSREFSPDHVDPMEMGYVADSDELPLQFFGNMSDGEYLDFIVDVLRPTEIEYVFVVVFLMLMIVGIIGNCLVVYVVLRNRNMVG